MRDGTRSRQVQWGETDAAGIVFYPNYFRWFDIGTHDLLRDLGIPLVEILRRGFVVPIIEAGGRFRAPLAYEDEVRIRSSVTELRTRAFRVDHDLTRGDETVCEGYEVRMWVRTRDGVLIPEPIPDDVRALLLPAEA